MKEKKNRVDSKILVLIVAIATLVISVTGATYAFFALSVSNSTAITGNTASTQLTLSVEPQTLKSPNTGVMVPQLGSAIGTAMNATNKCVDANGNVVCKVYKITVTNGSTAAALVNGTIKFTSFTTTNLRWRRADSATALSNTTTGSYAVSGVTVAVGSEVDLISGAACIPSSSSAGCTDISLATGASGVQTYYIVVWLEETNSDQSGTDANKTFNATVKFEGADGKGVTSTITA